MKRQLLIAILVFTAFNGFGQTHPLKGNGQVFWEEHFDWENPSDPKGWTAPEGWTIEDNSYDQNGYMWTWTKDSMQGPFAHRDGGYILNSTTRGNGFMAIDLDRLNAGLEYTSMLYVNSSLVLPKMDFSTHPSVIISLEQMFKYFNTPKMAVEVSNDDGAHWAAFDLKMGTPRGVNTLNLPNDQVAHFSANISAVAAGQPNVTIKITWDGSMLYFWMLDDMTFSEGWDYDLEMPYHTAQMLDGNPDTAAGFLYMMPKTQILPIGSFTGSVVNNGEIEQTQVHLRTEIFKNGVSQFQQSSASLPYLFFGDPADTLTVEQSYTPEEFGHYELKMGMVSDQTDQNPDNNLVSYYFNVTDSVFARTPDVSEADDSPWRDFYQYTHEGDLMAVEFDPVADCEASSISAFISKANMDADFKFVLLQLIPGEGGQPTTIELLTSQLMTVDSTLLKEGWITIPLDLDGQGEKLKAGNKYLAAVQFWTYITEDNLANRKNAFWLGSTKSYPGSYYKQWDFSTYNNAWTNGSSFNKMIRLNINNHDNRVDGILNQGLAASLGQNYPNPFSGETHISYSLSQSARVSIRITDITGKTLRILEQGSRPAGEHNVTIDNSGLDAGIYFYTLQAGETRITKRMMVTR
jgi:hypothetical protein